MTDKSPAYQWYPKDILSSLRVAALTDLEELWYRRALDYSWLHVTLPADPETLARIIGRGCTVEGAKAVLTFYTPVKKDSTKVFNDRQQKERQKQKKNRLQKSGAGKASAEKRKKIKELADKEALRLASTAVEIPLNGNPTLQSSSSSSSSEIDSSNEESKEGEAPTRHGKIRTIPERWQPDERLLAWAVTTYPNLNILDQVQDFVRHYLGAGTEKANWSPVFQTWLKRSEKFRLQDGNKNADPESLRSHTEVLAERKRIMSAPIAPPPTK